MRKAIVLALLAPSLALAQNAVVLEHSGYVVTASDAPLEGTRAFAFSVFPNAAPGAGETALWSGTCQLPVRAGYYATSLGEACGTGLLASHLSAASAYLEVSIDAVALAPRMKLYAVPLARVAARATVAEGLAIPTGAAAGRVLVSDAAGSGAWGRVDAAGLADGAITNAAVAAGAGVATSKLSGAVTSIANHGLGALATKTTIADADVAAGAAIATGKLSGAVTSIANHGLGALATKTTLANADVATGAAIATSKLSGAVTSIASHGLGALATKTTIADADVAAGAAIAGTKISPDFGAQDLLTTGRLGIGAVDASAKLNVTGGELRVIDDMTNKRGLTSYWHPGGYATLNAYRWTAPIGLQPLRIDGAPLALNTNTTANVGVGTADPKRKLHVEGGLRVGNSVYDAYRTGLPIGASYSSVPVHLTTSWVCKVSHLMFNVEFKGYNFLQATPIDNVVVGYLYATNSLTYYSAQQRAGNTTVSAYCSSVANGERLVFKISGPLASTHMFHASDLVVNLIGGASSYQAIAADTFQIVAATNSAADL